MSPLKTDDQAWYDTQVEDLWLYDKLILSAKMGYACGPVGTDVPTPGEYVVRPVTNILGMGMEAEIMHLEQSTDHLTPGHFWCEKFEGRHFTVDYAFGDQILCVEGFHEEGAPLYRWDRWLRRKHVTIPYPLNKKFPIVNCEFIGDKLIEVHLRPNPDFGMRPPSEVELLVVWHDYPDKHPEGDNWRYEKNPEWRRVGFWVRRSV